METAKSQIIENILTDNHEIISKHKNVFLYKCQTMIERTSTWSLFGQDGIGAMNHKLAKPFVTYSMIRLDDYDTELVKHHKLKNSQFITRISTERGRNFPGGPVSSLVKIDLRTALVYWGHDDIDGNIVFDTKGSKMTWCHMYSTKL